LVLSVVGLPERRLRSASPREWAGSVETASTRRPDSAAARAAAAAQVVLPTPPLPPKRWRLRVLVPAERDVHRDPAIGQRDRSRLLLLPDLAQPGQDVALQPDELLFVHLAELELHLRRQQLLAQRLLVVHLGVHRRSDLVEDETEAADQQAVEDDHSASEARSSLRRMLTKLYGGQGPVYLKIRFS